MDETETLAATQADRYLIFTRRGTDIDAFPAIKEHLSQFREQLEPKPATWPENKKWRGRKAEGYEWFHIQDNIAYWKEFEKPKILYQEIATFQAFALDTSGAFSNNKTFLIPDADAFLLPLLNSEIVWWFLGHVATKMVGDAFAMQSPFVSQLPIPPATEIERSRLTELAEACAEATKKENLASLAVLEGEILTK